MSINTPWLTIAAASVAAMWWSTPAHAGDSAALDGRGEIGAPSQVTELVVTATRRESLLSAVPESVSAFTREKMAIQGVRSMADLAKFTPGVAFDGDRHDVAIRGIVSKAGSGATGIYIDDTPVQMRALGLNANNTLPSIFDLDRIEVLRGPQGTLFGAGSEGGAVRYITPQPRLSGYAATLHAETASATAGAPDYEVGAAIGGGLIENLLGFRASAWARRDGGFIDRVDYRDLATTERNANRADTYMLRAALAWAPTAELTVSPSVHYQNRNQHNYDSYWTSISSTSSRKYKTGTPERLGDSDIFALYAIRSEYSFPHFSLIYNNSYYERHERLNGYSGTLYNLSYFEQLTSNNTDPQGLPCVSCTSARLLLPTGPNLPGFGLYSARNWTTNSQKNYTQEFRLQSNDRNSPLSWVVGLFYDSNKQQSIEEIRDPQLDSLSQYLWNEDILAAWGERLLPNGDSYINDISAHDRQLALFFEGTVDVTDRLKLTVGARYAKTRFDFQSLADGPQELNGGPSQAGGAKSETPFTPKLGLTFQASPDSMFYASASKGYRIGGATPPLPEAACGGKFPSSYNSDNVLALESGAKNSLFDKTLRLDASLYHITWNNIQQSIYVPTCGLQYTANVGSATSQGFDLQAQWRPFQGATFEIALGYTDAWFRRDAVDGLGRVLVQSGDVLDVAPWTAAISAERQFELGSHSAFVRMDTEYSAKRTRPIPAEDPRTADYDRNLRPSPATTQTSLRAGVALSNMNLSIYAENIFDNRPNLNLQHQDTQTLLYEAQTLRPRRIGISLDYTY